ncbi:MAG: folate-binding protein YgfZ [Actinomycetota bacterium]
MQPGGALATTACDDTAGFVAGRRSYHWVVPICPFTTVPGVVDRSQRSRLRFTGDQALWFCDQLLSNQVVNLGQGRGAEAMLLTPHGRITALLRLLHSGNEVLADLEPGLAGGLLGFFEGRIFSTRVQIADVTAELGQLSVLGPGADGVVGAALGVNAGELPGHDEHDSARVGQVVVSRLARPAPGLDLVLAAADIAPTLAALEEAGAQLATLEAYESLRVRAGLVRDRVDIDESYLPQEAALERAVHFAKGCYLGQEAVAMTQRGRIKRRVRHLAFTTPPMIGPVWHLGEEVGRVTSVSEHDEAQPALGIATVRTAVGLGEQVEVGPGPGAAQGERALAVLCELPGTVTGPQVPSARELRERLASGQPRL